MLTLDIADRMHYSFSQAHKRFVVCYLHFVHIVCTYRQLIEIDITFDRCLRFTVHIIELIRVTLHVQCIFAE